MTAVFALSAETASGRPSSANFDKLIEIYEEVSDAIGWVLWCQGATLAIQEGKAPPPSPMSPSVFYDKLQEQQRAILELPVPIYEAVLPPNSAVPTDSFDSIRAVLRSRVGLLQEATAEFQESVGAIRYLVLLKQSLEAQQDRLQHLARVLEELIDDLPWIPEVLLFSVLDVRSSYIPTVGETADILETKRGEAHAASVARREAVLAAGSELVNLLAVEAATLDAEAVRLRQLDEEVQDRRTRFEAAVAARDAAANEVQRMETYVAAAELDLQNAIDRVDEAERTLARLRSEFNTTRAKYDKPYSCPISGVDSSNCKEAAHQKYKDDYRQRREDLGRRLQEITRAISEEERARNDAAADVVAARANVASTREALAAAQRALDSVSGRMEEARQQLQAAAEYSNREKWKSRADIFSADNGRDSSTVRALVGILGG